MWPGGPVNRRTDAAVVEGRDAGARVGRERARRREDFRQLLIAARRAAGLKQAELAAKVGTTQSAIARLEGGAVTPTVDTLYRLADALDLHFEIAPQPGLTAYPVQRRGLTLEDLRAQRADIVRIAAAYGARDVRVFGSVARGEADAASDVDLLVDVVADAHGFAYFGLLEDLRRELEALLGRDVDIIDSAGLRAMRQRVLSEAVPL